jgi:electron transfer flavoprotein alpha subunit
MSVLVYTENWDGRFKKQSRELISYASKIAEMTGGSVTALSIGEVSEDELGKLGNFGAATVLSAGGTGVLDNQLYTGILAAAAEKVRAKVIVLANNNSGKALAPRLSVRLRAGLASGVTAIPESVKPFVVRRKVFSGKAFSRVKVLSDTVIVTLAQNSYEIKETGGTAKVEAFDAGIDPATAETTVLDVQKQTGKILLTDAEIVVSGGRGMKSPDNWKPLEDLAGVLGAAARTMSIRARRARSLPPTCTWHSVSRVPFSTWQVSVPRSASWL